MKCVTSIVAACLMTQVVAVSHSATSGEASWTLAEQALTVALHRTHPDITEWDIQPLSGRGKVLELRFDTRPQIDVARLGSRSAVRISTTMDQRTYVRTLWFSVSGKQTVMAARSALKAGSPLDAGAVELAELDIIALECSPVTTQAELVGLRVKRDLRAGGAICHEMVEPLPLVARGEEVTVRSISGPVMIIAKGIAQQDGKLGQVLRIRNPANRELYRAAVTGKKEVVVHD